MGTVEYYLQEVPLPLIALLCVVGLIAVVFIPRTKRLYVSIIVVVIWMTLGRLSGLGVIQAIAKATGFMAFMLVIITAYFHPGPRRRLPRIVWTYVLMGCIAFVYVLSVTDLALALVLRFQWVLMIIGAILITQTIVDEESMKRVLRAILIGGCIAIMFPLSNLLMHPGQAFATGLGRFTPYGANANQIGVLFALTAPLCFYFGFQSRHATAKPVLIVLGTLALSMGLLTGSRSVLIAMALPSLPIALAMFRRPIFVIFGGAAALITFWLILGTVNDADFGRLATLETERVEQFRIYIGIISDRLLFGLFGTENMSVLMDESVGFHPHNAYLEALYLGGLSYAIPMFLLACYSGFCALWVWLRRHYLTCDPLLVNVLAVFTVVIYAHGFVNGAIYYPTYAWAFVHLLLAMLFISLRSDILYQIGLAADIDEWDDSYETEYDRVPVDEGHEYPEYAATS